MAYLSSSDYNCLRVATVSSMTSFPSQSTESPALSLSVQVDVVLEKGNS